MSNLDYIKLKQLYSSKELFHHGVKGQKWGVRKEPEPVEKVDFDKAERAEKRRNKKIRRTIGAIAVAGIIIGTVLANKYRTERLIADTKLTDDEIKKLAEKTIHDQRSDSAKKAAATRAANKAANAVKETINKGKDVANNVTKNIPKDTYIKDLLREARQKSSTFRDMKNMLHHSGIIDETYLEHFGILGQKWGIRRFQNEDGTLTPEGKERYLNKDGSLTQEGEKRYNEQSQKLTNVATTTAELEDIVRKYGLENAQKTKTQVLIPKDEKQLWNYTYIRFKNLEEKYAADKISTEIVTLEDNTDYVVSKLFDKKLNGQLNYYEPLLYDKTGKKYDSKGRLYTLTKEYNKNIK